MLQPSETGPDGSVPQGGTPAVATEDVQSREEQRAAPMYTGRVQVYPKKISGPVRRIKWAVLAACLGAYYIAPWLRWDRGPGAPDQALLIDMPNRRGYFFWIEIWPQEVYYLTGLLVLGAIGLFLATSVGGRVWCGFTCPQTVWTDLFMWVERKIEGDRGARIRLDKGSMSFDKVRKKVLKHAAWILIAFVTGGAWVMYFRDAPTLVSEFFVGESSWSVYFFVGLFALTTYVLAGLAREQVCTYMCPWPRFQAALLDEDSLVVTYQDWRGEPRAPHKRDESWEGRGDCIDCKQCVAVCPTGIDIRDGLQLECIGCGLCVDACNDVMKRIDRPVDLIAFATERAQIAGAAGEPAPKMRLIRPRTIVYVVLLALVGLAMLISLTARATIDINVLHDRNPLFVTLSDGSIRNGYTIKILNKTRETRSFTLAVEDEPGLELQVVGQTGGDPATMTAEPDSIATYRVHVELPRSQVEANQRPLTFLLTETGSGETAAHQSVFRGPKR